MMHPVLVPGPYPPSRCEPFSAITVSQIIGSVTHSVIPAQAGLTCLCVVLPSGSVGVECCCRVLLPHLSPVVIDLMDLFDNVVVITAHPRVRGSSCRRCLGDKVNPGSIARRQVGRVRGAATSVKDTVMGSAGVDVVAEFVAGAFDLAADLFLISTGPSTRAHDVGSGLWERTQLVRRRGNAGTGRAALASSRGPQRLIKGALGVPRGTRQRPAASRWCGC